MYMNFDACIVSHFFGSNVKKFHLQFLLLFYLNDWLRCLSLIRSLRPRSGSCPVLAFSSWFFGGCWTVVSGCVISFFSEMMLFFQFLSCRFLVLSCLLGPLSSVSSSFPLRRLSNFTLSLSSSSLSCVGFAVCQCVLRIGCFPAFLLGLLGLFGLFLAFLPSDDFRFDNFAGCSCANAGGLYLSVLLLGCWLLAGWWSVVVVIFGLFLAIAHYWLL